jgi:hypothetical protein
MTASDSGHHLTRLCLRVGGAMLLILGATVLIGWIGNNPLLTTMLPDGTPMGFNSALCFVLTGASLMVLSFGARKLGALLGGVLGLFALAIFLQYPFGRSFGIDQLFWPQTVPVEMPGRLAMNTTLAFMLTALALFAMAGSHPRPRLLALAGGALLGMACWEWCWSCSWDMAWACGPATGSASTRWRCRRRRG